MDISVIPNQNNTMQILRPPVRIQPSQNYTLDDLTKDHQLLKEQMPTLDHERSMALLRLLISQCVAIGHKIERNDAHDFDSGWKSRAQIARVCKEANIASIKAHISDLEHRQKLQRIRLAGPASSYEELALKCDQLQAALNESQRAEAYALRYKRTLSQVIFDMVGEEVSGEIRSECRRRLEVV